MDDTWTWIEGHRIIEGTWAWWPLFCYRAKEDAHRAPLLVNYLKAKMERGEQLGDGLHQYDDFRVHPAGVFMETEKSLDSILSPASLENLSRILSKMNRTTCEAVKESTGEVCMKPLGHTGKHSPKKKEMT